MDNKEFAKVLCEATELLNESSRQKFETMSRNKRIELADEIAEVQKNRLAEKAKREYFGKNAVKSKIDEAKMKLTEKKLTKDFDKIGKTAEKFSARANKDSVNLSRFEDEDFNLHRSYVNKKKDRKAKEAFMKEFGGKSPKNKKLHERINKRGEAFKSQNESIAILLTEAALLLNESVGVKDKSTDKIVKVFKDNAEAFNWIASNGGNERYQLTNRLK